MRAYVIRRLLLILPTLLAVTMAVFATVRFIPGSTIDLMIAEIADQGGGGDHEAMEAYSPPRTRPGPAHPRPVSPLAGAGEAGGRAL